MVNYYCISLSQPRALRGVAIPPKYQHHSTTGQQPHVSPDAQRVGRCDADAKQISSRFFVIPTDRPANQLFLYPLMVNSKVECQASDISLCEYSLKQGVPSV